MTIDAVITWVDGDDPAHRAKLDAYLAGIGGSRPPTARATRFNDAGEIEYCVASIFRFAPWIRTLHIVTADQSPGLLRQLAGTPYADRVRVVDHRTIFAGHAQHLPTFNSRAIITMLWRIPDLAERFVYFNDDFMLLRPLQPTDFFRGEAMVLRGAWLAQAHRRWLRRAKGALRRLLRRPAVDRAGNHDAQEASARLAGFTQRYFRLYHVPYPFQRSVLAAYFDAHPDLLASNASYRLRSSQQFKAECLAAHLAIAQDRAVIDNALHAVQLKPRAQPAWRMRRKMARADRDPGAAFVCVQSLELADATMHAAIVAWLDRRIGRLQALVAGPPRN